MTVGEHQGIQLYQELNLFEHRFVFFRLIFVRYENKKESSAETDVCLWVCESHLLLLFIHPITEMLLQPFTPFCLRHAVIFWRVRSAQCVIVSPFSPCYGTPRWLEHLTVDQKPQQDCVDSTTCFPPFYVMQTPSLQCLVGLGCEVSCTQYWPLLFHPTWSSLSLFQGLHLLLPLNFFAPFSTSS